MEFTIEVLSPEKGPEVLPGLMELTRDAVESGASVGFLLPGHEAGIEAYWREVLRGMRPGGHAVIIALDRSGRVAGSVQLIRCAKANGRHRAEVAKLLVHRDFRRMGLGRGLMERLEILARRWGLSLMVLDTATEAAIRLYRSMSWTHLGVIPGYALDPDGSGPHDTHFYYKTL